MRSSLLRAAAILFALGVLATLTLHAGLTACTPTPAPSAPPAAQALPPPPAADESDPLSGPADDSWRYMGATKAAPVFHPPRAKPSPPQQQQQQQQQAAPR
jgi:hypothetical protein